MAALPLPISRLPDVWRVDELAASREQTVPTGHTALDAELPGGGWPVGSLVEVLQPRPEQHAWQLTLPGLSQACRGQSGPVVLVGAPFVPFGPGLEAQGVPVDRLLCVASDKPAPRLWAAEQALRCADVVAVLAWLPRSKPAELRRLQLAAQQHDKLLFVFRTLQHQAESSPARLRLVLDGLDEMQVRILKRRGPPRPEPLSLPAHPARLASLLKARRTRAPSAPGLPQPGVVHAMDRTAAIA